MSKPLDGIRVLDLSRVLAGPWATQMLADFGADVIKVEKPGTGDDTRHWGPPYLDKASPPVAAYFLSANRGKRSIAIDFTTAAGSQTLRKLAARADVVVENYKVGSLANYGLDYPSLRSLNERLIYCSITGYGQDGPYAARPGYDFILQGVGGLMSVTGSGDDVPGGGPTKVGVAVVDILAGLYASNAILAALRHRDVTNRGQYIDLALLDVQVATLANQAMNYLVSGNSPSRMGNAHPSITPYESFQAQDRVINIAVGNDAQFTALCRLLDVSDLAVDARFATNAARVRHRGELRPVLQAALRQHQAAALVERLNAAGVPAGLVNDIEEVFDDPQVRHRVLAQMLVHPEMGRVPSVACPIRFSETPVTYDIAPPALGQHTMEVLRSELGLSDDEIAALRNDGTL